MTRTLLQERDLFFITSKFHNKFSEYLLNMIVVPKVEFKSHSIYHSIHANCCYKVWQINYDYVIVASIGWYEQQNLYFQQALLKEQIDTGSNMIDEDQLITQQYWNSLNNKRQNDLLCRDNESIDFSYSNNELFDKWNGVFPERHGGNCFAAVLYGMTKHQHLLNEWIHQETFKEMLKKNKYGETDEIKAGCIIVFHDNNFQHACYMIDDRLAFNKSGQTFWNPWHISPINQIKKEWKNYSMKILGLLN